jgi:hypothetical protein
MHAMSRRALNVWEHLDKWEGELYFCWYFDPVYNLKKKYRDSVWTVLTSQATESTPSIVIHDVKEIETWILRLLSAPVPVPGSTRVEVSVQYSNLQHKT